MRAMLAIVMVGMMVLGLGGCASVRAVQPDQLSKISDDQIQYARQWAGSVWLGEWDSYEDYFTAIRREQMRRLDTTGWSADQKRAVENGMIGLEMSPLMVEISIGKPSSINSSHDSWGWWQHWRWSNGLYATFLNDRLKTYTMRDR